MALSRGMFSNSRLGGSSIHGEGGLCRTADNKQTSLCYLSQDITAFILVGLFFVIKLGSVGADRRRLTTTECIQLFFKSIVLLLFFY